MRTHVDRHFAGSISVHAERSMRQHLPTCDSCRERYARQTLLARLDPQAVPAAERIARGLGLRLRHSVVAMRIGIALAGAAALLLLVLHRTPDGFSPRGSVLVAPPSHVFVYEVRAGETPSPAADSLKSGDELAFAYENGSGKRRLAVFGVDEHAHVYWFHPAWQSASDDPVAIPIEHDSQRHELPEAIRHRFDGTHLEIRSVFLDDPISVRQVEALLREHPREPLPIPGAIEASHTVTVIP